MALEPLAERGFAARAREYESARPGWPAEVVDALIGELGVTRESSTVVDLITARRAPGVTREERYQSGAWREAFGGGELFEPFRELEARHEQVVDIDGLLLHMSTWSFIAALAEPERESLLADVRAVLERELPDPDRVVVPYRTDAHWTRRRGSASRP